MRQMINAEETNSSFWRQMGNIIAQFDGTIFFLISYGDLKVFHLHLCTA